MSQSATPATQNDMTTCLETFEEERFCGFSHRHVDAEKPAFRARLPPILTFCSLRNDVFVSFLRSLYLKIDVSFEASVNFQHISQSATPATEFAPCRHLTQPCQCDPKKTCNTTRLKCCPATQNDAGHIQSAAPATKTATHLLKTSQKYCACHTKRLSTRYKTRLNARSARPATRNEATKHLKPPKMTTSAELTIGTAI